MKPASSPPSKYAMDTGGEYFEPYFYDLNEKITFETFGLRTIIRVTKSEYPLVIMETEKQLKGPRASAIKSIQLLIDKNTSRKDLLTQRAGKLLQEAQDLETENEGLMEQIKKLKGDSSIVSDLKQITSNLK